MRTRGSADELPSTFTGETNVTNILSSLGLTRDSAILWIGIIGVIVGILGDRFRVC
jgi:hypothetical protein